MKKGPADSDLNGFLDRGTEFTGELRFQDLMRIDGKFKGKIISSHTLIVGDAGEIDAEIDVGTLSISGRVEGVLKASDRIEIHSKGRVYGTLIAPRLIIEEGAIFQGKCEMESTATQLPQTGVGAPILHLASAKDRK